jgi:hypothetical protein
MFNTDRRIAKTLSCQGFHHDKKKWSAVLQNNGARQLNAQTLRDLHEETHENYCYLGEYQRKVSVTTWFHMLKSKNIHYFSENTLRKTLLC